MTIKKSVRYWQSGRSVHYQRDQLDSLILDLTKTGHKKVQLEMSVQDLVDLRASLEAAPVCPPTTGEMLHEIRENSELRKAVASWQAERIKLMTQVAMATKALEFYADDSHDPDDDESHGGHWFAHCDDFSNPVERFIKDAGNQAKEALAEIRGLE